MFEVNDEAPYLHYLTDHLSAIPANGIAPLPKTSCDARNCEIASWLKLSGDTIEHLHFSVPRTRVIFFEYFNLRWNSSKMIFILQQEILKNQQ